MMTLEDLAALAEDVEDHYQTVTDEADANFKHGEFRDYPSDLTRDYRRDVVRMDKLYSKFLAVNDLCEAKGIDEKRQDMLQGVLDDFYIAIDTVQASNGMFTAYLNEGVAAKAIALFDLLTLLVKGQQLTLVNLIDDFESIEKRLVKARKMVKEVKVQLVFNLAAQALTLCIPQLRAAKAVYAALAVTGAKSAVDGFLGPKGPTLAGGIKNAAVDYAGFSKELGKTVNSVANVYSTLDALDTDTSELALAKKIVDGLVKDLAATQKALGTFQRLLKDSEKDLLSFAVALDKAVNASVKAADAFDAQRAERADLVTHAAL